MRCAISMRPRLSSLLKVLAEFASLRSRLQLQAVHECSHSPCATWPDDDRPNDYGFRMDGRDAGRARQAIVVWRWTVYGSKTQAAWKAHCGKRSGVSAPAKEKAPAWSAGAWED
jgi:hypothetical protein